MECRSLDGVDIEDLGWFLIFPSLPSILLEGLVKIIDGVVEWVFLPLEAAGVLGGLHSVIGFNLALEECDEGEDQKQESQEANCYQIGGCICLLGWGYRSSSRSSCWGRVGISIRIRICVCIGIGICVSVCVSIGTRISICIGGRCGSGSSCGNGQVDVGGGGGDDPVADIADDKPNLEAGEVYLIIVVLGKGQPYPTSIQTGIEENLSILSTAESIHPTNQRHISVVLDRIAKTMIQVILIFDCIVLSFYIITQTDKIVHVYQKSTHPYKFVSGVTVNLEQELLVIVWGIHVGFDRGGGHSYDVVHWGEGETQEEGDDKGVCCVETDGNCEGEGAYAVAVAHSEGMGCLDGDMRTLMENEVSILWRLG